MRKLFVAILLALPLIAQDKPASQSSMNRSFEAVIKNIDDVLWFQKVGDIASVDKSLITSKPGRTDNPTGQGAGNPLIIPVYVFTPKALKGKAPMLVFVHGGVHG